MKQSRWLLCGLLFFAPLAAYIPAIAGQRLPPPEGVLVPPFEPVPDHSLVDSPVVIQGRVTASHAQTDLEPTKEFIDYSAERFAGWPDAQRRGFGYFTLFEVEVIAVLSTEPGRSGPSAGETVYLYADMELSINDVPRLGPVEYVFFLEAYVHKYGGSVPPLTDAAHSFVLPSWDAGSAILSRAPEGSLCPDAALTESKRLILDLDTTAEERAALLTPANAVVADDGGVWGDQLAISRVGEPATVSSDSITAGTWRCEDVVTFDSLRPLLAAHRANVQKGRAQ
jgi:hypothetical protein